MTIGAMFRLRRERLGLGWPGALGAAGLALSLALFFSVVQPALQRLQAAQLRAASLQPRPAAGGGTGTEALPLHEQLAAFYRLFPDEHDATQPVGQVAAIARRNGLPLLQADYKAERDQSGKLTRLQMNVPLKGEYQAIRRFLSELHAELPGVSLAQVQFERQKVGDPQVEAKVRLVIYLGRAS